ncbi:MAG: class I SAM-dependent methyltransferase [Oscillospiraceae bacterium]|nr:class I SAM-dependent methyltransferase [Oscillospiraceae bacterium]
MEQLENIRAYWNQRAEGYSAHNMDELEDQNRIRWVNTIMRYAPEGDRLKILDIGCGPGFFSILMAQCGHEVIGVDYSDEMVAHARENAATMRQNIEFRRMDAQHLEFPDESFDLVISRNVMWCLEEPERAYREWLRVLRKGGRIVNFDGNFYLDRFDAEYSKAVKELRDASEKVHARYVGNVDTEIINRIAMDLPLSKVERPGWDFTTLVSLGAHKFDVELFDHLLVPRKDGDRFYCRSFVVSAQK